MSEEKKDLSHEEIEKNLSVEEIVRRIDKLANEIAYSEQAVGAAGMTFFLAKAVDLVAEDWALGERQKHEAEFHKKVIRDNADSEEK